MQTPKLHHLYAIFELLSSFMFLQPKIVSAFLAFFDARGSNIRTSLNLDEIIQAIDILKTQKRGKSRNLSLIKDYDTDNVSEKVIRIILSHTDFVNKYSWKKY